MSTGAPTDQTTAAVLPEPFARIIHRLRASWSAPPLPPRIPRALAWGGRDLSASAHRVRVDGNELWLALPSQNLRPLIYEAA